MTAEQIEYLAGPMSYRPQFNFPLFDWMAAELRAEGRTIITPSELDDPHMREQFLASPEGHPDDIVAAGTTWGDLLARDVKLLGDNNVQTIWLLPEWEQSRGARLESFVVVGLNGGKAFQAQQHRNPHPIPMFVLQAAWGYGMIPAEMDGMVAT